MDRVAHPIAETVEMRRQRLHMSVLLRGMQGQPRHQRGTRARRCPLTQDDVGSNFAQLVRNPLYLAGEPTHRLGVQNKPLRHDFTPNEMRFPQSTPRTPPTISAIAAAPVLRRTAYCP